MLLMLKAGCFIQRNSTSSYRSTANRLEKSRSRPDDALDRHQQHLQSMLSYCPLGSRSNIDDNETFKALQMSKRRAALTRFTPFSYF